ncbi:MAG TPA: DUF711 family protein [Candidatus Limnocylindrales bacterium]|nr:DUF711 family protein [Candidatus Limnocylindrales bacterium]
MTLGRALSAGFCLVLALSLFAAPPSHAQKNAPATPKIKVRTITAFVRLERGQYQIHMAEAIKFLKIAKTTFESREFTVQTLRIATQPFPEYTQGMSHDQALQFFKNLDGIVQADHVILSIGPAYLAGKDGDAQADLLGDILLGTKSISGTVYVADKTSVNWPAVRAAARVMKKLSDGSLHSEANFHFAALANVPQASPFFPAAYLTGMGHQFAVGLESAGDVAAAVKDAPDYSTAQRRLIDLFFQRASEVENLALRVDSERGWAYLGLDLSPAPGKDASIGAAIENISKQPFGASGTLTAVGIITSAMKEIGLRKTGYSGLMLPVLEDPVLAERWNAGLVTLDALVSYSAVCGTGLDTVPLPGDATVEQLARIIGDVATLSVKWNKPLSARLLPVAGKLAGQQTEFTDPSLLNGVIPPITGPAPK